MKVIICVVLGILALNCSHGQETTSTDLVVDVSSTAVTGTGTKNEVTTSNTDETIGSTTTAAPTATPTAGTSAKTNSITDGPTTMTPSSTTPKPTPWEWRVNDTDSVCIIAKFHATITVDYDKTDNTTAIGTITVPEDAQLNTTESHCGNETQVLQIDFKNGNNTGSAIPSTIKLTFSKTGDKVEVSDFELVINNVKNTFEGARQPFYKGGLSNTSLFSTGSGHSYVCNKATTVVLGKLGSISFTDLQIEAFRTSTDNTFSLAEDCNADVNNIVPIAVGCSLAALVVIVLVAYLIGRRQKRQRGYESV